MRMLLLLPLLLVTLVLACNGGTIDLIDREISDGELVAMMLPQADLGSAYADLQLDDDSGFETSEDAAEDAFDEEDEAEDIVRFGRVTGYGETFISTEGFISQQGVFLIAMDLTIYESGDSASGYLRDELEDTRREVGVSRDGGILERLDEFHPEGVGDESAGMFAVLKAAEAEALPFNVTLVMFRRGRLIGEVVIVRFDEEDVRQEVTELAHKLDERILAVLRGEIEPQATPTPRPTDEPAPTPDRTGAAGVAPSDFLESFRFSLDISIEAGGSVSITSEGAFQAPDRLSCSISIALGGLSLGTSEMIIIGDDAWIDSGDGFQSTSADDFDVVDDLDLCPGSPLFWEDYDVYFDPTMLQGLPDTKNGVVATRYPIGEVFQALAPLGFLPPEAEGVSINVFDVWLATDGGWPVAMNMDMSANAETFAGEFGLPLGGEPGQQGRITLRVDISDVNSAGILIEPPLP